MHNQETIDWKTLEEAYGFIGNSLLKPMNQTADLGITVEFWESFPHIPTAHAQAGLDRLIAYASSAATMEHEKAVEACAVEYTKLFIGPPAPAAPPWETMNKEGGGSVGFGQATFEMRRLLSEAGLELKNENNQYEDHLGIELLYLSVLAGRLAHQEDQGAVGAEPATQTGADAGQQQGAPDLPPTDLAAMKQFIQTHPLAWIETFRSTIDETYPQGYFSALVELAQGLLEWSLEQ